jgi:hypothetical protein
MGTQSFKPQHTWPLILQVHHLLQAPLSPSCQHPFLTCCGHHPKKKNKKIELSLAQVVEILESSMC